MQVVSIGSRPVFASETIAVDATAGGVGFTLAKYTKSPNANFPSDIWKARSALVTVETDQIRVNFDPSVTVTASANGHLFNVGDSFIVDGAQTIADTKMIRITATASVKVTYFG